MFFFRLILPLCFHQRTHGMLTNSIICLLQLQSYNPYRLKRVRRDSNPRPATLEIAALPAELHTHSSQEHLDCNKSHSIIFDTVPAPIVLPPSRIAKRIPSSIAIGTSNSAASSMLSPGITISVPAGRVTVPVTSVVRK